jgi:hypothetical protein
MRALYLDSARLTEKLPVLCAPARVAYCGFHAATDWQYKCTLHEELEVVQ